MIALFSFGQSNEGMIKLGTVQQLPMRNAEVFDEKYSFEPNSSPYMFGVAINSKTDSVFSLGTGTVQAVFDLGSVVTVVVKDSSNIFFGYLSLSKTFLKKNDTLVKGFLIGLASGYKENLYQLTLTIGYKNDKYLVGDKIWQLIKDE